MISRAGAARPGAFRRGVRRLLSVVRVKRASIRLLRRASALKRGSSPATEAGPLAERLAAIMSFRVTSEARLGVLSTVLSRLETALASSSVRMHVTDSSAPEFSSKVRTLFDDCKLPVTYRTDTTSLCQAYQAALRGCETQYFFLQFDDQLTAGLHPDFLDGACQLLARYKDHLSVVSVLWPWAVELSEEDWSIRVVTHRVRKRRFRSRLSYSFGDGPFRTPLVVERIGRFEFGIFENFTYGFYFNHLVAPVQDFADRLQWYMQNVSATSAHEIERAASTRTTGPYWTHIALCLNDLALVDLDFEHTPAALRAELPQNEAVYSAVANGRTIRPGHLVV